MEKQSKIIIQPTMDQTGRIVRSYSYVHRGKPRFTTYSKEAFIIFCKSAGINYIEKLEVKGNGTSI